VSWYADGKPVEMPHEFYSSRFFVDKAIEFLQADAASGQPFFSYIGFQANHLPVQAPAEFVARHKGRYDAGWAALRAQRRERAAALGIVPADAALAPTPKAPDWDAQGVDARRLYARQMEVYAAMAEAMDHEVGRLVAHLKQTGQYDDTVFVFLSDNGAEGSDPYAVLTGRMWLATQGYSQDIDRLGGPHTYGVIGPGWASAAASPLSTYKFYSGEGGIRVPLIIAGAPGAVPGRIHHAFTHVLDVAPTLLELAGAPPPGSSYQGRAIEPMTGRSLVALLRGEAERAHAPDEPIGFELTGNAALFKGDLKLVKVMPPLGDAQWRLFDVRRDPGETKDLRALRRHDFDAMRADYESYARSHGVVPVPDDYDPVRQVAINNLLDYFLPTYGSWLLAALALGISTLAWRHARRRAAA
jgi:arylsulfatase/uncharacterized sulfatase